MANINSNVPRRFENGATLEITNGGTTYIILNIKDGTFAWKPSMYERVEYSDNSIPQTPLEGGLLQGELDCTVNFGDKQGSDSLYALLMTAGASGLAKTFTSIVYRQPGYRGSSTGETVTISNPWLAEPPQYNAGSAGQGLDTLAFKMKFKTGPVVASY